MQHCSHSEHTVAKLLPAGMMLLLSTKHARVQEVKNGEVQVGGSTTGKAEEEIK